MAPRSPKKKLDLSVWQSVRSHCPASQIHCSRCGEATEAWKSTRGHCGRQPRDKDFVKCKSCSATLPTYKGGDDVPVASRGSNKGDGSSNLVQKDEGDSGGKGGGGNKADKARIKELEQKLADAIGKGDNPLAGTPKVEAGEPTQADKQSEEEIKSLQGQIKACNEMVQSYKAMGACLVNALCKGDVKPYIDAEIAKRDSLHLRIAQLKPPEERAKQQKARADQLAKQAASAERSVQEKRKLMDEAKEALEAAQIDLDKQVAYAAEINTKAAEAAKVYEESKPAAPAPAAVPAATAYDMPNGERAQFLLLAVAAAKANPNLLATVGSDIQQSVQAELEREQRRTAETNNIAAAAAEAVRQQDAAKAAAKAAGGVNMAAEVEMGREEIEDPDENHDALWQLADSATSKFADEADSERTKRVQSVYDDMATRAKEVGCKIGRTKKQRTD